MELHLPETHGKLLQCNDANLSRFDTKCIFIFFKELATFIVSFLSFFLFRSS